MAWIATAVLCRGELFAYEPFDGGDAGRPVAGSTSGTGFGGAWFDAGGEAVHTYGADSLQYYSLPVQGARLRAASVTSPIAWLQRSLASPIGYAGATVYVSVLVRPEGQLHDGGFNGFFGVYLNTGTDLFAGKPGGGAVGEYVLEDRGGANQVSSAVPAVVDQTAFLVLKAEFGARGDSFTLYVNPPPVPIQPAVGVVRSNHQANLIQGLTVYSTGAFSLDELRMGTTYADVAPFQEPILRTSRFYGGLLFQWDAPGFRLEHASEGGLPDSWIPFPAGDSSPVWMQSPAGRTAIFRLRSTFLDP